MPDTPRVRDKSEEPRRAKILNTSRSEKIDETLRRQQKRRRAEEKATLQPLRGNEALARLGAMLLQGLNR